MITDTNLAFAAIIKTRQSRFILDLSNETLIGVLNAYQDHKRKTSPGFSYDSVISNIKKIQESVFQDLLPEDVTDEFYSCMVRWGMNRGLKLSTIQAYCNAIKTALTWGTKHGARVSTSYNDFKLRVNEPHRVSLSADEVSHIAHFDCRTIKGKRSDHINNLEKVRDSFVLQTNLFCRFSDLKKICPSQFDGTIFSYVQQKTGQKARVDISRYSVTPKICMGLLKKYDYTCPYKSDINNYNKLLHELLGYIGGSFDDEVTFEQKVNGEVIKTTYKKRDLISSHCSRRTAITLAVATAKTETEVRRCSGHTCSGSDSFRKYIVYED